MQVIDIFNVTCDILVDKEAKLKNATGKNFPPNEASSHFVTVTVHWVHKRESG